MNVKNIVADHVYLACGYTDMRKSVNGLSALVQYKYNMDPFSTSIFIFCGKSRDIIKALLWEGDGFLMLYKRIEGGKLCWPRNTDELRELTERELRWLLDGLSIEQPKAIKKISPNILT